MNNRRTSRHCNEMKVWFVGRHTLSIPHFLYKCLFFKERTFQHLTSMEGIKINMNTDHWYNCII